MRSTPTCSKATRHAPAPRPPELLRALLMLVLAAALALGATSCKGDDEDDASGGGDDSMPTVGAGDELPVSRVALYQNGVGYFEHRGRVEGDVLTLRIRPDQINDILKSLTVIDLGEGRPVSISLPADRQAIDAMSDIPDQIRHHGGLLSLLQAFRGARMSLVAGGAAIQGRLVGLENVGGMDEHGNRVPDWRVTIKQDSGTLKVVELDDITSVDIKDKTLEVGLEKSLDVSLNEGSWKPIELNVRMNEGGGTRDVMVSYIVSMPVWKPAYRLVLSDEEEKGLFQGWAVVDNVSGTDWNDVSMSLVAGTPMSFRYDLYRPQFVQRPDLTPRGMRQAVAPVRIESASGGEAPATATGESAPGGLGLKGSGRGGGGTGYGIGALGKKDKAAAAPPAEKKRAASARDQGDEGGYYLEEPEEETEADSWAPPPAPDVGDFEQNFEAASEGSEVSALFQYDISAPVTVPDRSSALVNLVQARGEASEIVLFRPDLYTRYDALNPYRAVKFRNESGYALEPGPITLYREGTFIGEGFLERTERDEVAFVTFALDPQVTLKTSQSEKEEAARINRIEGGTIYSEVKFVTTVTYKIKNERDEPITAMIRRPIRAEYELEPKPKGTLEASGAYFIPFEIPASTSKEFEIREVTPVKRTMSLNSGLALDLLKLEVKNAHLDEDLRKQMKDVIAKQKELGELRAQLSKLQREKREHETELARITSSLEEIKDIEEGSARELRKKLADRALELEKKIGEKTTKITELGLKETDAEVTLRALFGAISFDASKVKKDTPKKDDKPDKDDAPKKDDDDDGSDD